MQWNGIVDKVVIPMVLSPIVGFGLGYLLMLAMLWAFRRGNPHRVNRGFRLGADRVGGRHVGRARHAGRREDDGRRGARPRRRRLPRRETTSRAGCSGLAATAIALGTYAGGWRIMRTLGRRIIDLSPPDGFAAETVAPACSTSTALVFAAPISTTHTITSSIMGVGATRRLSAVRWGVAGNIVVAWVLTIPMAALVAAACYAVARPLLE